MSSAECAELFRQFLDRGGYGGDLPDMLRPIVVDKIVEPLRQFMQVVPDWWIRHDPMSQFTGTRNPLNETPADWYGISANTSFCFLLTDVSVDIAPPHYSALCHHCGNALGNINYYVDKNGTKGHLQPVRGCPGYGE